MASAEVGQVALQRPRGVRLRTTACALARQGLSKWGWSHTNEIQRWIELGKDMMLQVAKRIGL